MNSKYQIPQMKPSARAQRIIKALLALIIVLWLVSLIYVVSNKSVAVLPDYDSDLLLEERSLFLAKQQAQSSNSDMRVWIPIYKDFSLVNLCQKKNSAAESNVDNLLHHATLTGEALERVKANLFAANMYRELENFAKAENVYEKALLGVDSDIQHGGGSFNNKQKNKAILLSNLGLIYYMQAQSEPDLPQRQRDYLQSRTFFQSALKTIPANEDSCLNKSVSANLANCLQEAHLAQGQ